MARHSGLLTPAATTADGVLDALWGFFNGNTDGGWTWAREGTTDAIYGYKDFGTGGTAVRRVVWICGDAAGSTPGLLSIDAAGAARLFIGAGRIAAGSFAWAGWTNAAPMGSGGIGRVHALVAAGASTTVKTEAYIGDYGIAFRMEGSSASTARVARAGALCQARSTARGGSTTGDPDGLRTGAWVSGLTSNIGASWLDTDYAAHSASASASHGWVTVSGVATAAQSRIGNRPGSDSTVTGGKVIVTPSVWQDATSGLDYGFDVGVCGGATFSSATKELSLSGIGQAYVLCRDSSGSATPGLVLSAATLAP